MKTETQSKRVRLRCRFCSKLNSAWEDEVAKKLSKCSKCRLPLSEAPHKKWDSVNPDSYIHPLDKQALQALKAIPGVDAFLKKLLPYAIDKRIKVLLKATSVRVGPDQCAHLDRKLQMVANTLGMEKPDLYLSVTNQFGGIGFNAMTTGVEKPVIIVYTGLLERMTDAEITAVLAHEMGHIHCEHVLYKICADMLIRLLIMAAVRTPVGGILGAVSMPIQYALLQWSQKAELSCDRTALMVMQDERVVMSALAKLAGASLNEDLNLDAFIRQAKEFDQDAEEDLFDKVWTFLLSMGNSHPFPVWRISEILKWVEDDSTKGFKYLMKSGSAIH